MNAFTKLYAILTVLDARVQDARNEKGVSAIEYALMAGAIAAVVTGAVAVLGGKISGLFNGIAV